MLGLLTLALLTLADDSAALNVAIGKGNAVITLEPRDYGIGAPLDGTAANVTLRGVPGATRLLKLDAPSTDGILSANGGRTYRGWTFEGIEFAGNSRANTPDHYFTLFLSGSNRVRFERCRFRDMVGAVQARDTRDIAFHDCEFFGTTAGKFQAGVIDPPAVPMATFGSGVAFGESCRDMTVSRCRFHFCETGIAVNTQSTQSSSNLRIEDCEFRADWWDNPAPVLRFTPTAFNAGHVTLAAGGFKGFAVGQIISFRREIASGTAFTSLYAGRIQADGNPFANAAIGDVVETADGRRGQLTAIESPSLAYAEGWESIDTYESADPLTLAVPWRLSRTYACGIGSIVSDTELTLYSDPVNMFTGERASEAKLDLSKLEAKVQARTIYSGLHVNGGLDGLLISGNRFVGSWADQCSVFNLRAGARIVNNSFRYGQDEGITLTNCPRSIVSGNEFINSGVSPVYVGGGSDSVTITGNTFLNWGLVNPHCGAIDGNGKGLSIAGNTATVATAPGRDWSRYLVNLVNADSSGTTLTTNSDGGSTAASLSVDLLAAPAANAIMARDVKTVVGAGAKNVRSQAESVSPPPGPLKFGGLGAGVIDGTHGPIRLNVDAGSSQSGTMFGNGLGDVTGLITGDGAWMFVHIPDAKAPNQSIFLGAEHWGLPCYKDSAGQVYMLDMTKAKKDK